MRQQFFVSGIGTEVGKTVVSAFLCRALDAHYWKPVQAGELDFSDTQKVTNWSRRGPDQIHPETFRLTTPASPHFAAKVDGLFIKVSEEAFRLPDTDEPLIVEGAGGLLVPFNDHQTTIDLIRHLQLPVLLVARNYLGSINHTLMSLELLRQQKLPLAGVIYSGNNYRDNIEIISKISGREPLLHLPEVEAVNALVIDQLARDYGALLKDRLR